VPRGGAAVAAKTGQPTVPADDQRPGETPGPEPAVPMSLRWAPACGSSPGRRSRRGGGSVRISGAGVRGSARRRRFWIFLLRSSGVWRAVHTLKTEPVPAVLQLLLPSGVAAGDRARAAVAAAGTASATSSTDGPVPRALSWLNGIAAGHTPA